MRIEEHYIVYPEGDFQEISSPLAFNQLVGLNGVSISLPLPDPGHIVYRVYKISKDEGKGGRAVYYYLDLVTGEELRALTEPGAF